TIYTASSTRWSAPHTTIVRDPPPTPPRRPPPENSLFGPPPRLDAAAGGRVARPRPAPGDGDAASQHGPGRTIPRGGRLDPGIHPPHRKTGQDHEPERTG